MEPEDRSEHAELSELVPILEKHRSGIVLTGHVKDGKVELDQRTLDAIAEKFAGADLRFIAVNAPFDPTPQTAEAPRG